MPIHGDWRLAIGDWRLAIGDWRLDDSRIGECRLIAVFAADGLAISCRNCGHLEVPMSLCSESRLNSTGAPDALAVGMNPKAVELQARTQRFAAAVIMFCERLPDTRATRKIVDQLLDSAGSTDSNYRAACRSRSPREFLAKIGVAAEEADESKGWLELLVSSNQVSMDDAGPLIREADELTAIFVKSRKTAEGRQQERTRLAKELKTQANRR